MTAFRTRPARILVPALLGPLFLFILMMEAYFRFKLAKAGMAGWISEAFGYRPIRAFGIQYALRILIPLYFGAGIYAWAASLIPGLLARREWLKEWKARESLAFGLSALLWTHIVLWWQVPTALWVMPGIRVMPFWLIFPLLGSLALAYPLWWLSQKSQVGLMRRGATLACWLLLWSGLAWAPQVLPRPRPEARGGDQPCKVLLMGIDGLRSDTFLERSAGFKGVRYENAYTVIPATRLLWHILWGGDPMTYTIGHVGPSKEEFEHPHDLVLLREAMLKGWRPRFYIDDGGTIGVVGRHMDLDDSLMPASGWENFVNSNLAASFPLYAVWENWLKPFPTTNPWASMDEGLKEALRMGRGSGWVMFHSCLAHQPIFMNRQELKQTGRWWTLVPRAYEPYSHIGLVQPKDVSYVDPRTGPFLAYQVRMGSILKAWEPIWNALGQDPNYKGAVRTLFSDHGERFHNVANGLQLQGVHGFNLDPWECRAAMLMAGPGFSDQIEPTPRQASVSLLGLRDGIQRLLADKGPFDAAYFETCEPMAPFRYHTLATSAFGPDPIQFRAEPEKDLAVGTYIAPGGIWFTTYSKSIQERAKDASVGYAVGRDSYYFKPMQKGGAMKYHFRGYEPVSADEIDEDAFQKAKTKVEAMLSKGLVDTPLP